MNGYVYPFCWTRVSAGLDRTGQEFAVTISVHLQLRRYERGQPSSRKISPNTPCMLRGGRKGRSLLGRAKGSSRLGEARIYQALPLRFPSHWIYLKPSFAKSDTRHKEFHRKMHVPLIIPSFAADLSNLDLAHGITKTTPSGIKKSILRLATEVPVQTEAGC